MKNTTLLIPLIALLMTACQSGQKDFSTEPIDISDIISKYDDAKKAGTEAEYNIIFTYFHDELDDQELQTQRGERQGLATLTHLTIKIPKEKEPATPFYDKAERLFNASAIINSIWSDYEIFARAKFCNETPLVTFDSIRNAIKDIDLSDISDEKDLKVLTNYRDSMVWAIDNADDYAIGKKPDEIYMTAFNAIFLPVYEQIDSIDYAKLYDLHLQQLNLMKKDWDDILSNGTDNITAALLDKIQNADNFEEQCSLLLLSLGHSDTMSPWSLLVIERFIESGRYTLELYYMWKLWRTLYQEEMGGLSRTSIIHNWLYNKYRRAAFITTCKYLATHKVSKAETLPAIYLAFESDLIRNGSFILGNDAALDLYELVPEYDKPSIPVDTVQ